jgi:tRNA(fMet)-specific endonuclease VapC
VGLILDTSLLVRAERSGTPVRNAVQSWAGRFGASELGISVISLAELGHGIARAENEQRRTARNGFVSALRALVPIYVVNEEIALRAGLIDGDLRGRGLAIGLADALIAATALVRGDGVATFNGRHFKLVPGLDVVEL